LFKLYLIPIFIDNISISNINNDGSIINEGTEFSSYDIRFIACDFNSNLISETTTSTESIMVKLINPYGEVMTYGDGSSPSGFTAEVGLNDLQEISYGTEDGNGSLNDYPGNYIIEFWYDNLKIREVSFIID